MPRILWVLAGLLLAGWAVYALRGALTPIFFALLIAYLLDPLVDRFEARGVNRAVGIVVLLCILLGALSVFLVLLLPSVIRESVAFAHELPAALDGVRHAVEPLLESYGVPVPHTIEDVRSLLGDAGDGAELPTGDLAEKAAGVLRWAGTLVLGGTATALNVTTTVFLVPVFAFYLLYDFDRMTAAVRDLIPHRYRPFVVDVAHEVDEVLGQFIRGQLLVMLVLAVLYSIAYSIVGIRLAIPIGIVAGLLSFIPYVGGASALVLALLMCALSWESWWQVGGVVIAYGLIQALEGFVITPKVVGDKVGLSAVWVMVALLIGGELFGFLGVLIALPAAAICKIFVVRAVASYKKSELYREGGRPPRHSALADILGEEGLPDDEALAAEKRSSLDMLRAAEAYGGQPPAESTDASEGEAESVGDDATPEPEPTDESEAEVTEPESQPDPEVTEPEAAEPERAPVRRRPIDREDNEDE